jgi:predicted O-methyltransferase YrrM
MMPDLQSILEELESFGQAHDSAEPEHLRRLLNLERDTARLLDILLRAAHARSVLEIGTSNGYSTLWIAEAMQSTGGRVTSIERSPDKHAMARANLTRAGLIALVDLHLGDATEIIAALRGPFDTVFFDADRVSAPHQLELLMPKLTERVLILADNALSHPDEIRGYLDAVNALPEFRHIVVPIGKGLSIAQRG